MNSLTIREEDRKGMRETSRSHGFWHPVVTWGLVGFVLMSFHVALAFLSPRFAYEQNLMAQPIILLVGSQLLAGGLYLLVIWRLSDAPHHRTLWIWILLVGAVMRTSMLMSTPMLEDDYYRYLWDGAVVAHGMNPYAFAPRDIAEAEAGADSIPVVLRQLAADSGVVFGRINHPHLRTIYPPVAQAMFALAHGFRPWSLTAWRLVLLGFDVATLGLLIMILRIVKRSPLWLVVYWWNPVVVKEIFNAAHMDVIALPFVLGAILLAIYGRHLWAVSSLGLAMGAKIWPVVLLPVLIRPLLTDPRRLIPALVLFAALVGAMFLPVYAAGLDRTSGFVVYGHRWEMNDALFMLILWGVKGLLPTSDGQLITRIVVAVMIGVWIGWLVRENVVDPAKVCERCLLILAAVFLLSPTQFPWYYVWLIPLLTVRPWMPLLVLTALLPLYDLRFYFDARGRVEIFDYGIVWVEYLPVWWLLIRQWRRRRPSIALREVAVSA